MADKSEAIKDRLPAVVGVERVFDELFENPHQILDTTGISDGNIRAADLLCIADDIAFQREFLDWYSHQRQENQEVIRDVYHRLVVAIKGAISQNEHSIQTIDTYGQRVSAGSVIGGVGTLLWGSAAVGAVPIVGPSF